MPIIKRNRDQLASSEAYEMQSSQSQSTTAASDYLIDIREYDIPYYTRVSIDLGIRVGLWYKADVQVDTFFVQYIYLLLNYYQPILF